MVKRHSLLYQIFFLLKINYNNFIKFIKNFKTNFIRKKNRIINISNFLFTKDGFSFYTKKLKFNLNFIRYKIYHSFKKLFFHSRRIIDSGYLAFTLFLYILFSIIFFLLAYNIWVQSYYTVKVPSFKDTNVLKAIEQIQSLKLIPVIESRFSDLPYGSVISQYPGAGHVIKQQRKVKLIVSKGFEYSFLEDFSGQSTFVLEKKVQELSRILKREIKIEIVGQEYSDLFDNGLIISQEPSAGTDISSITTIKIVVSKGKLPETFLMPDFVGKLLSDVQKEADSLGLILDIQYQLIDNLDKVGIILNQTPAAKQQVSKGTVITIIVGQNQL